MHNITIADIKHTLWARGELTYKLDSLQRAITKTVTEKNQARKILILSSRQIGKTYWACVYALQYLLKNPKKIARVIAPTFKQCQDLVNDNLALILQDAPHGLLKRAKTEYRYNLFNGSSLRLGALERAYVDGNRGGNASLIIYEECGFVTSEDFNYGVDSVLGPQLLRSNGIEIFVTSPSEEPDHPVHTRILGECEKIGTAFRYTVHDSPSITPAQIKEAMNRCGGEHTDAWKREYLAQIIRVMSKVIIPGFEMRRHVREFYLPNPCHLQYTVDWGGTRDLTVALLHTYDWQTNQLLIWDEIKFDANTPTAHIHKTLDQTWGHLNIYAKHADVQGQTLVDLFELGSEFASPPKTDWLASVQAMATLFELDLIVIHPRCKFLIHSIRAGVFNKNRTDFERLPEIGHCDALASLMYANRCQNRENPYAMGGPRNDPSIFVLKETESQGTMDLGEIYPTNKWGSVKTFGNLGARK